MSNSFFPYFIKKYIFLLSEIKGISYFWSKLQCGTSQLILFITFWWMWPLWIHKSRKIAHWLWWRSRYDSISHPTRLSKRQRKCIIPAILTIKLFLMNSVFGIHSSLAKILRPYFSFSTNPDFENTIEKPSSYLVKAGF